MDCGELAPNSRVAATAADNRMDSHVASPVSFAEHRTNSLHESQAMSLATRPRFNPRMTEDLGSCYQGF
jgi:hypothetical protein